ncbi:MAG: cysteine desulfurase [Flavobacteriales bacterium]|nr:cysteine desulfurase [Flavobacteriales bacterium]
MQEKTMDIPAFDVARVRQEFPILERKVNEQPLVYFDNAATVQKPQSVIDALVHYYSHYNANIHRGVHSLAQEATQAYEDARKTIQQHINAEHAHEIIFTMGTTDAINLVMQSWGRSDLQKGDTVLISALEHHSNMVPWHLLKQEKGIHIEVIPIHEDGSLNMDAYTELLQNGVKLVCVNHVSNALGSINPIKKMVQLAHAAGAKTMIDGAQALPHAKVDVRDLNADFYAFSGHKVYGPTGIGILYGKEALLNQMPPWRGGGEMIASVTYQSSTYNTLPHKFEAGTPNIAGGIVLGSAIDFVNTLGVENIERHEAQLLNYLVEKTAHIDGLKVYGTAKEKAGVFSFLVDGTHPYDVGTLLDQMGVAVRTGHHCAEPLMNHFGIPGTIRASFACYNTFEEVDVFVNSLERALKMLR